MNATLTITENQTNPPTRELKANHTAHLLAEGFSAERIDEWHQKGEVFSVSEAEALEMGFKIWDAETKEWRSGPGLYLKFTEGFAQLRLDTPIFVKDENGKTRTAKYLTPHGVSSVPMLPLSAEAWTEGFKDARAGSILGGIPTAAAAGLSHYKSAFPEEGSGLTTIADSDAWWNPDVFGWLFHSGLHHRGKCVVVPMSPADKCGLVEFFKSGQTAEDYRKLLDDALTPKQLLLEWPTHWQGAPENRLVSMATKAIKLAAEHLNEIERLALCNKVAKASPFTRSDINGMLRRELKKDEVKSINLDDREARYKPLCEKLGLDYRNCVTATTFDQFTYRQFDGKKKGEPRKWAVLDQSFYKLTEDGSHWQLQDDLEIQRKIALVGEKAFKLRVVASGEAEANFPYECDKYVKSAFAYTRTRLHCQQPDNSHLISFKNGTLDLRTGEFGSHDPTELITRHIPYDYKPNEQCPGAFSLFIKESFGEEMLPVIQAFTAMFLDPSAPYGRFPHLIGQSGGGKGTLGRFWNSLYGQSGSGSSCAFEELSTAEKRHQNLTGKSIWGIADIGGYIAGLRAFYELVDNGEMSGRALYSSNGYNKRWNTRFWVASVDHLQIENAGDGWKRRAYPIPVRHRAVKPDPFLRQALEDCKAAVISWALAMPKKERDEILTGQPSIGSVMNAAREAELYSDSVRTFLDLSLRPSPTSTMDNAEMHSLYTAFCKEFGYSPSNYYKFLSHLKTIIPAARVDRRRAKKPDGSWGWEPAYWQYITPLDGVFRDFSEGPPDESTGYQGSVGADGEPQWRCRKSKTREGGLDLFEAFWSHKGSSPPREGGIKAQQGVQPSEPPRDLPGGSSPPREGGIKAQQGVQPSEQALVHHESDSNNRQCTATESGWHEGTAKGSGSFVQLVHPQNETFSEEKKNNLDQPPAEKKFSGESLDSRVYEGVRVESEIQPDPPNPCAEGISGDTSFVHPENDQRYEPSQPDYPGQAGWAWVSDLQDWFPVVGVSRSEVKIVMDGAGIWLKMGSSDVIDWSSSSPPPKAPPQKFAELDYSDFPWSPENGWQKGISEESRTRSRKQRAEKLREALLAVRTQDDFDAIFMGWGTAAIRWVDVNLLTPEQVASRRNLLESLANTEQQKLL